MIQPETDTVNAFVDTESGGGVRRAHEMSWDEYRALPQMNPSTLVHGIRSMKRLKWIIDSGGSNERSDAMVLGSGVHALLLEPATFEQRFSVMPSFHLEPENTTKDGSPSRSRGTLYVAKKEADFAEQNSDREIIDREDYDRALMMIESINDHPTAKMWLDSCEKERVLIGSIDGVPFKGRVDLIGAAIVDVKTTNNAGLFAFGRTAANLHYSFKIAIYRELALQVTGELLDCKIIAQEDRDDFDTAVYEIPGPVLDNAMAKVRSVVRDYKKCVKSKVWPGVDGGEDYLQMYVPPWSMGDSDGLDWGE